MGSAGQPAESDFDSGADTDTYSDDEATALDNSDMPTYLTEEQQAQWLFLGYQKHKHRWGRFMKKPVRKARRIARRAFNGKGKGRGKGKGKRRRLHDRGILAFLASLIGPQHVYTCLGSGRNRRRASGKGKGRRGIPEDATGKTMECDICHSAQHFRRERLQGDGGGMGPSIHLAQTNSDI
eukprot:6304085-Pyramimonas_sp.AAC.1